MTIEEIFEYIRRTDFCCLEYKKDFDEFHIVGSRRVEPEGLLRGVGMLFYERIPREHNKLIKREWALHELRKGVEHDLF